MSAITIRALPDSVHDRLREMASSGNLSVEALVRNLLGEATRRDAEKVTGMAEASSRWIGAPKAGGARAKVPPAPVELWGALRGCVHVPAPADLMAPADEAWDAAS